MDNADVLEDPVGRLRMVGEEAHHRMEEEERRQDLPPLRLFSSAAQGDDAGVWGWFQVLDGVLCTYPIQTTIVLYNGPYLMTIVLLRIFHYKARTNLSQNDI